MSLNKQRPILIAAGGTGGHIYPALQVAQILQSKKITVVWAGTKKGMEAQIVPAYNIPIQWLNISGLRKKSPKEMLLAPIKISRALLQAWLMLRKVRPRAVLGMGGFVAGPVCLMARLMGIQTIIHEQNAIAGLTNKWLAKVADGALCAYPNALANGKFVGNPVRSAIYDIGSNRQFAPKAKLNLLVVGGSLGAVALNQTLPEALALMDLSERPNVVHQCGKNNLEDTQQHYERQGVDAKLVSFIDNMAAAYSWADVILCRAGAMTVSEVCAAALPAIYVPYPHAVDDHQSANASFVVNKNGAVLVKQNNLNPSSLASMLAGMSRNQQSLHNMAKTARKLALPEAGNLIVHALVSLAPRLEKKAQKLAAKAIAKSKQGKK